MNRKPVCKAKKLREMIKLKAHQKNTLKNIHQLKIRFVMFSKINIPPEIIGLSMCVNIFIQNVIF